MNQLQKRIIALQFILFLLLYSPIEAKQIGRTQAEQYKNNVAHLFVKLSDGEEYSGFGFVVGKHNNKLYIVTAEHVVRSPDPDVKTKTVSVRFEKEKGKSYNSHFAH